VLIEGGASLLNSFINKGLWDEVHIITNRNLMVQNGLRAPLLNAGIIFEEIISGDDKIVGIKNNGQL
jgi:diaminohydroxyphosphoribosylaminopyrimidine deaminase/5-amino-6-(5-phosphoribosylamino)uracil reductase